LQTSGKARRKAGQIALEGVRLIGDALDAGFNPDFILYRPDADTALIRRLQTSGVECYEVTPEILVHAANTQTPQGMIAVLPLPELPIPESITFALILDAVADPGNLGAILRSAAAATANLVILAPNCVDPFNPKVLRSAMGAHFRVPLVRQNWAEI